MPPDGSVLQVGSKSGSCGRRIGRGGDRRPDHGCADHASTKGSEALRKATDDFAASVSPMVRDMRGGGLSLREIAERLAADGIRTVRGGQWTAMAVKNILDRAAAGAAGEWRMINAKWLQSVIKVGGGRGFVMADDQENLVVVTAAHCLPHLPEAHPASASWERTYEQLLGRLGNEPSIAAEVLFVDPVADIAILGTPDNQEMWEQAEAFDGLVESTAPLPMAKLEFVRKTHAVRDGQTFLGPPEAEANAWLLGLDGEWFSCRVSCLRTPHSTGGIGISDAAKPIVGGMSGSPVMVQGGVIGIVSISFGGDASDRQGGPQAYLPLALPGWMLGDAA